MNSNIRQMYPIGQMFFIPQLMKLQNNSIHYKLDQEIFTGNYWINDEPIYRIINKWDNTEVISAITNIIDNSKFNIKQVVFSQAMLYTKSTDDCFIWIPSNLISILENNTYKYPQVRYFYRKHGNIITYMMNNSYYIGGYVIFITDYIKNTN